MSDHEQRLTIGDVISSIMPTGSFGYIAEVKPDKVLPVHSNNDLSKFKNNKYSPDKQNWSDIFTFPTDAFVTVAHLINVSGLLTYFDPNPEMYHEPGQQPQCFTLSMDERKDAIDAGLLWSENFDAPLSAKKAWREITRAWKEEIRASAHFQNSKRKKIPSWWRAAIKLAIITDEACVGIGAPPVDENPRWLVNIFEALEAKSFAKTNKLKNTNAYRADRQRSSFGIESDADVACVQPKSRVAVVGCGLRNLTKNVAYIPHVGNVRCHWHQPITSELAEDGDDLDILLLPIPMAIKGGTFEPVKNAGPVKDVRTNWGNFKINQNWLTDKNAVIESVKNEVRQAKAKIKDKRLNGIIFPEYSLEEPLFNEICDAVKQIEPQLEFAVAGSSTNCEGETGNFVLTAIWKNNFRGNDKGMLPPEKSASTAIEIDRRYLLTSRRKHHRWKLSKSQITDYQLQADLSDTAAWWEAHQIAQREIHFFHFRKTSVFTTMICEDLARSDPCHHILRSIGPNLLFALLMDGPQIQERWSARYAATLADDPGTSVLTITSVALVDRSNSTHSKLEGRRSVGFWQDEDGNRKILELDEQSNSLLLQLKAKKVFDPTIDGRQSEKTWSWIYNEHHSI